MTNPVRKGINTLAGSSQFYTLARGRNSCSFQSSFLNNQMSISGYTQNTVI